MSRGCPAVEARRLGAYWTATIGRKKAVVFKSESHLSQDTDKHYPKNGILPNAVVWKQIIGEVQPALVITTGTGGGIGRQLEVGDVIVSPIVRFASRKWLKRAPFHGADYHNGAAQTRYFTEAKALFKANAGQLPRDNTRPPKIVRVTEAKIQSRTARRRQPRQALPPFLTTLSLVMLVRKVSRSGALMSMRAPLGGS